MAGNNIRFGAYLDDHVSSNLSKIRDKFDLMGKGAASASLAGNVGALALAKGVSILASAASRAVDVMGDVVEGALKDEESIARLTASLRANVPAWDGSTDAIERTIKAAQRLGFEDDELRDSLAGLVGATHDIAKAQAIQNTAMDLARFKHISLADASEALTRVEAGSYRILKSLGIVLKDGATQTEALAAVQKVATGQAEAYAETNRGKLLASQIKLNESMEVFGTRVLPLVISGTSDAADAISGLSAAMQELDPSVKKTADEERDLFRQVIEGAKGLGPWMNWVASVAENAFGKVGDGANIVDESTRDMAGKMAGLASAADTSLGPQGVSGSFDDAGDEATKMRRRAMKAAKDMADAFKTAQTSMAGTAKDMIDQFFNPIETRATIFDTRRKTAADIEALRLTKTKTDHRIASDAIIQDLDDQASQLVDLGEQVKLTDREVTTFANDTKKAYAAMGKKVPPEVQKIITKLREFVKLNLSGGSVKVNVSLVTGHVNGTGPLEFATGGVVPGRKGQPQLAIVHGGETVIPTGQPGYSGSSGGVSLGAMSGSSSPVVINYNVMYSTASVVEAQTFSRAIVPELTRELRRQRIVA